MEEEIGRGKRKKMKMIWVGEELRRGGKKTTSFWVSWMGLISVVVVVAVLHRHLKKHSWLAENPWRRRRRRQQHDWN